MGSDFSKEEIPHYPGVLTVIRAFSIDEQGVLRSPQRRDFIWKEGVNQALCDVRYVGRVISYNVYTMTYEAVYRRTASEEVARLNCQCGFYGYFKPADANTYLQPGYMGGVVGIVSAYGRLTVGDQGLRAEKMKIEALIVKEEPLGAEPPELVRPVKPKDTWKLRLVLVLLMILLAVARFYWPGWDNIYTQIPYWACIIGIWVLVIPDWVRTRRYRKAVKAYVKAINEYCLLLENANFRMTINPSADRVCRFVENYPDIPIYYSLAEALEKHPLSGPPDQ